MSVTLANGRVVDILRYSRQEVSHQGVEVEVQVEGGRMGGEMEMGRLIIIFGRIRRRGCGYRMRGWDTL